MGKTGFDLHAGARGRPPELHGPARARGAAAKRTISHLSLVIVRHDTMRRPAPFTYIFPMSLTSSSGTSKSNKVKCPLALCSDSNTRLPSVF